VKATLALASVTAIALGVLLGLIAVPMSAYSVLWMYDLADYLGVLGSGSLGIVFRFYVIRLLGMVPPVLLVMVPVGYTLGSLTLRTAFLIGGVGAILILTITVVGGVALSLVSVVEACALVPFAGLSFLVGRFARDQGNRGRPNPGHTAT